MDLLAALENAVDEALATDLYAYSDPASVKTLSRIGNKVDAFKTRALMSFEDSGEWALDGARSSVGWVAAMCRLPDPRWERPEPPGG
jgi:hypothetical protein